MRRCKHVRSMESFKHRCDVVSIEHRRHPEGGLGCMSWKQCVKCGSWLSLGESNDEPEAVRIEIRAAEIAAWPHHGFAARWRGCESCGWLAHERDIPLNHDVPITHRHTMAQYEAGHLANVIATHDGSGGE